MKTIDYTETITSKTALSAYYQTLYANQRLLFFDIETTGLAADHTTLYLIGVLWYDNAQLHIRQWFNEDGYCEKELLDSFHMFCQEFDLLVHFNGLGFDLPYLNQKAAVHQLADPSWNCLQQIDIYRLIRPYKQILQLEHMKQKSIETYLGLARKDTYTGKELIHIYQRYVARPNTSEENLLLLHNHDDLLGMPQISTILNYVAFFEQIHPYDIHTSTENDQLNITFSHNDNSYLPNRIALTRHSVYLNAHEHNAILQIPIRHTTLQHYFPDYKNYYYLPQEDMAIHKSVATYVEPYRRVKATRNTCYIKQTDQFIPCFCKEAFDSFQESPTDKQSYQTVTSFLEASTECKVQYIQSLLSSFL